MLYSITREAKDARAHWAAHPDATEAAHCHHETPFEGLTDTPENRIAYILSGKPKEEQALRLRLFRAVPDGTVAAYLKATATAWAAYLKAKAPAGAAYLKATAPAGAAYQKATATAEAAYQKAKAPAWAAYQKATAPAEAAYRKATVVPAHRDLCPTPDCPWDGRSIFGGAK